MDNSRLARLRRWNSSYAGRYVRNTVIGLTAVAVMLFIIFGLVNAGVTERSGRNGEVQSDKWGSVQIWDDPERGVTCYTRTGPTGFSCVKTGQ